MSDLRRHIERALDEVLDPCSVGIGRPAGLVTMGLIKSLEIHDQADGRKRVQLSLRLTSPCCMMGPHFASRAEAKMREISEIFAVEIAISPDIDWEPHHMREDYRKALPRPKFMKWSGV